MKQKTTALESIGIKSNADFDLSGPCTPISKLKAHKLEIYNVKLEDDLKYFSIKKVDLHGSLSPSAQHRVVYRKMCRRFPVVLQEIQK